MLRGSSLHTRVCATCAEMCDRFGEDPVMKNCAEICHQMAMSRT